MSKTQNNDGIKELTTAINQLNKIIETIKLNEIERLHTVSDLAVIFKSNQDYVRNLIKAGLIKVIKLGCTKTTQKELDKFLDTYMGWDLTDPFHPVPPEETKETA